MKLLAGGISPENKITIIVLCIAIVLFIIINIVLVISLHRRNSRLAKRRVRPQEKQTEITENTVEENSIIEDNSTNGQIE